MTGIRLPRYALYYHRYNSHVYIICFSSWYLLVQACQKKLETQRYQSYLRELRLEAGA